MIKSEKPKYWTEKNAIREQSLSMGETGAEGIELGYEILMHVVTGVLSI